LKLTVSMAAWGVWMAIVGPSWTAAVLVLGLLVVVPLGLAIADRAVNGPTTPVLATLTRLAPIAAAGAAASFVPDPGPLAAALTLPWLALGAAAGVIGVGRFLSRRNVEAAVGTDAALVFLAVGAGWLTISRAGLNPLGFSDAIVELTAVHFHYAGFALPLIVGVVASILGRSPLVPLWVAIAVPLTAAGITVGGVAEWLAATFMAAGGLAGAALVLTFAMRTLDARARVPLVVAGVSLAAGMLLALGWAWSARFGWDYLGLDGMARYHGTLNGLGFGLVGLVGIHLLGTDERPPATPIVVHPFRPSARRLAEIAAAAGLEHPTSPVGVLAGPVPAGYQSAQWSCEVANGFDAACDGIRRWQGQRNAGITLAQPDPVIEVGSTVALSIPVGPMSVSASARIVEVVDEPNRFGFTYATLPHHPEDGEESFIVERRADGSVHYVITAVWRPAMILTRLIPPLTGFVQRRAIGRYLAGVSAWVPTGAPTSG
jgi:uncharacterized protein (UPF0548 family)